jgi:prepilin-type processing-associated H-X9-DG protein
MIQILILVLIGLICGGILTNFIVQTRAAAARAQCYNNLRSLALAIANYHECYSKFPKAAEENPDLLPERRLSWIVGIWPFVEAGPGYSKMDHKKGSDAEENCFAALIRWKTLDCPGYVAPPTATMNPTCYVGITGIGADAINLPVEDRRAGFFGYERILKLADFKNHASSILMLAETSQVQGSWTAAGSPTTRGLIPDGSPYLGAGGQFGGNHRHGANVAFMDGSVRFVEQSIDPAVWEAMATLSGKSNRE